MCLRHTGTEGSYKEQKPGELLIMTTPRFVETCFVSFLCATFSRRQSLAVMQFSPKHAVVSRVLDRFQRAYCHSLIRPGRGMSPISARGRANIGSDGFGNRRHLVGLDLHRERLFQHFNGKRVFRPGGLLPDDVITRPASRRPEYTVALSP